MMLKLKLQYFGHLMRRVDVSHYDWLKSKRITIFLYYLIPTFPGEGNGISHSSILAWRMPWTEEAGGLQSKGSQRVRHNWATITHSHWPTLEFSLFPSFFLSFFSLLHFLFFSPNILVLRKAISSGQYPGIQKGSECMLQLFGVSSAENTCSQLAEAIGHVHVFLKQAQVQY